MDKPCLYRNAGFWNSIEDCADCKEKCEEYHNVSQKHSQDKLAKSKEITAVILNKLFLIIKDDHPGLMQEINDLKLEDVINRVL